MLKFTVDGQKLELIGDPHVVADSFDFLTGSFKFYSGHDWDLTEKHVFFQLGEATPYEVTLTDDEFVKTDHVNLTTGIWSIYVIGYDIDGATLVERITTNKVSLTAQISGVPEGEPFPPSIIPDVLIVKDQTDEQTFINGVPKLAADRVISDDHHLVDKKHVADVVATVTADDFAHNSLSSLQGGSSTERYHMTQAENTALHAHSNKTALDAVAGVNTGDQAASSFNHNDLANKQGGTTNQYYHVTAAEKTVIQNTSGTNTGDQDVSGAISDHNTDAGAHSDLLSNYATNADLAEAVISGVADGAVTPKKTSFLIASHGKNLYNPSDPDILIGKYLNTSGVVSDLANRCVSGYMPVTAGKIVVGVSDTYEGKLYFSAVTAYDANKLVKSASGATNTYSYTVPSGVYYIRITYASVATLICIEQTDDGVRTGYEAYFGATSVLTPSIRGASSQITQDLHVHLPPTIWAVKSRAFDIYNNQVCIEADRYRIGWTSDVSGIITVRPNRATFNYATAATRAVIQRTYDGESLIGSSRMEVITSNALTNPVVLLSFGDSLTNHCKWQAELVKLGGGLITTVGARSRAEVDSGSTSRTIYNEGRSGFSAASYLSATNYTGGTDSGGDETPHIFWNPTTSAFSWSYYVANNFPVGQSTPTAITLFLGMNDLGSKTAAAAAIDVLAILTSIRAWNATIPVIVITPQFQATSQTTHETRLLFQSFAKAMQAGIMSDANAYYLPLHPFMDSSNNYPTTDVAINTRNTTTVKEPTDKTHPDYSGHWQIADMVYGVLSKIFG